MLPENTTDTTVLENTMGAGRQFGIDIESVEQIMKILTDLYSDPELAVIREYACNALDSHIEAGVNRPIEITLPTWERCFYVIQDFGTGLSVDEMYKVYSMYGASTKRDSNNVVGSFGLGSKSALTYTNSFNVESVKDGVKAIISIGKNDHGIGELNVVDTVATSEPNGVKITVPVKKHNNFADKSRKFFSFWAPGTVLINGEPNEPFEGDPLATNIWAISGDTSYVVMGNVAYPLDKSNYDTDCSFVARVEIGGVAIAPSREALFYNPRTQKVVSHIVEQVNDNLLKKVNADLDTAQSMAEAYRRLRKWAGRIGSYSSTVVNARYKGAPIPNNVEVSALQVSSATKRSSRVKNIYSSNLYSEKTIIVYGFPSKSVGTITKEKIKQYVNGDKIAYLMAEKPTSIAFDGVQMVDYKDIKAVHLPQNTLNSFSTKIKGSWYKFDANHYYSPVEITELDSSLPIVYVSSSDYTCYTYDSDMIKLLAYLPDNVQFLKLEKNRWTKFKRDFPNAMHLQEWANKQFTESIASLSRDYLVRYHMTGTDVHLLRQLDATKIDDPDLVNDIKIAQLDNLVNTAHRKREILVGGVLGGHIKVPTVEHKCVINNYALLSYVDDSRLSNTAITDLTKYINMVYAESIDTGDNV